MFYFDVNYFHVILFSPCFNYHTYHLSSENFRFTFSYIPNILIYTVFNIIIYTFGFHCWNKEDKFMTVIYSCFFTNYQNGIFEQIFTVKFQRVFLSDFVQLVHRQFFVICKCFIEFADKSNIIFIIVLS
ncbi:MAG: hypothetical protein DBX97_03395 [Collinsella tanakaei]|nr:MAG: hypothetical protein DBX97_03395 [Collinsella tanakaei]